MRDGKATRERIEQAAMGLFVSQGVSETTIRDIATAAGVAEGALYRHHRGKDELILALFERNWWFSTSRHIVSTNAIGLINRIFIEPYTHRRRKRLIP